MTNEKLLSILLRVYFFVAAGWSLKNALWPFFGDAWNFWSVVAAFILLAVSGAYLYFGIRFDDILPSMKRHVEAVFIVSFFFTFSAIYTASVTLQVGRTLSGLRASHLIVNSLMAAFFYLALIVLVETYAKMKEVRAGNPPDPQ